jgi:hypothetical protein
MTGSARKSSSHADAAPKMELQRIRVRSDGYDASGAYWGAGPDVFIASGQDGNQEITVRAKSTTEARTKVMAELARAPGAAKVAPHDKLGGASPNKTRYEIDWHDPVAGSTTRIRITYSRDYLIDGQDHIEVAVLTPKKAALPITCTGYRSQFLPALELINAGGPVTFVTAWLDREAKGKDWQKRQTVRQQGNLFQWADANTEVGKRKRSAKAKRPKAKPTTSRRRDRDPE